MAWASGSLRWLRMLSSTIVVLVRSSNECVMAVLISSS